MILDRLQREAIARVFSDLIEADSIIDDKEIEFFEDITSPSGYRISQSMLAEAKSRTYAWAVNTLQQLDPDNREELMTRLRNLALNDGTCVPLEALQILAVKYALDGKAEVFSIPSSSNYVDAMNVIYIESENSTLENQYIHDNFRSINNEFHLAGFDFVYIPQFAEDYRKMDSCYLRKVISYIVPSWNDDKITAVQNTLCSLTTSSFCHSLLHKKMGLQVLGTKPAFLFKISDSKVVGSFVGDDVEGTNYSNYLKVNIDGDILLLVKELMDTYHNMVSNISTIEVRPRSYKFIYSGFHKSLFDLIVFGRQKTDYKLVINILDRRQPSVSFKPLDGDGDIVIPKKMSPMAATLYILIIKESINGQGLDWRENISREDKIAIMQRYNSIYIRLSNRDCPTEYKDLSLISKLKKELKSLANTVGNISLFIPEQISTGKKSIYHVPASSDLIEIIQ